MSKDPIGCLARYQVGPVAGNMTMLVSVKREVTRWDSTLSYSLR